MRTIVILTGAGISAESGLKTFRDSDGLWEGHRIEEVATPEAFARNPALVQQFYNQRRQQLKEPNVQPNRAHLALAQFEKSWRGEFLLITQNVDNLHERAGSQKLLHMHGALNQVRCTKTGNSFEWYGDIDADSICECCQQLGTLRPDIVWFGEMPMYMDEIYQRLETADVFVAIGTSGLVYPAAGFVQAVTSRCLTIECNLNGTAASSLFQKQLMGPAGVTVPELLALIERKV